MQAPARLLATLSSSSLVRPLAHRISRRGALQRASAIGTAIGALRFGHAAAAQTPVAGAEEIGFAVPGESSLEFICRIDQNGADFNIYGYVTHIAGLDDADIFNNDDPANRTEADAKLTLFGPATLAARSILENIFAVTAIGQVRLYVNETGGGRFDRPEAFFAGTQIGTAAVRIRSIVNVQAPQAGIAGGTGTFTITDAQPFTLGSELLVLGGPQNAQSFTFTGQGTLLDPAIPRSFILAAGAILSAASQ